MRHALARAALLLLAGTAPLPLADLPCDPLPPRLAARLAPGVPGVPACPA